MGWQMAYFGPFFEIGPAPCGEMKDLVAPGSLYEGSHSDELSDRDGKANGLLLTI